MDLRQDEQKLGPALSDTTPASRSNRGLLGRARDWLAALQRKAKLLPRCTSIGSSSNSLSQDLLCHLGERERLRVPFPLSIICMDLQSS